MRKGFIAILLFPLLIVLLIVGLIGARFVYDKLREPNRYTPTVDLQTTPPAYVSGSIIPKVAGTKALLPGAKWVPQTFNNCGPATTAMVLQYFGINVSQEETKAHLRTNPDDKNVFTYEISDYLKSDHGIESRLIYGGDLTLVKKLIANGFYVVIEDWLHPNEDIGHTTIIRGYDDSLGVLIADDSYTGVNITYPYQEFVSGQWKAFNYELLPVYKAENEDLFKAIVGDLWNETAMYTHALEVANNDIASNPSDMYAYFNKGSNLFALGKYTEAKDAYEKSQSIGWPKRMLWYQIQPIENYNILGDYQKAIDAANLALWSNDSFAEAHLQKAIAYKGLNNVDQAKVEVQTALSFYPNFKKAQELLNSLQ